MERPIERELPANLYYYEKNVIQDVVESGFIEEVNPISGHEARHSGLMKFLIPGTDAFVDLFKSNIVIEYKITGSMPDPAGGSARDLTPDISKFDKTALSVVNNFAHSLFKTCKVRLGNVTITQGDSDYAYKAFVQNYFNTSKDAQETYFELHGWCKDTAGKLDDLTTRADGADNEGLWERRRSFMNDAGHGELIFKPNSAIFFVDKAMIPYLDIEIEMMRHPSHKFPLMCKSAGNFKVEITRAFFAVQKYKLAPAYVAGLESMLRDKNEPIIIPLPESVVNFYTVSSGTSIYQNDTLFYGRIPKRIVIGFVDTDAYNGSYEKNPFNFKNNDIRQIKLLRNGIEYPRPALNVNFTKEQYRYAYHCLLASVQSDYNREVLNITLDDFKAGSTFFSYDMSPDQRGSMDHGNIAYKPAQIKVQCTFGTALTNSLQMMVYYDFDTSISINYRRDVILHQS
jgi:hypothetical protein